MRNPKERGQKLASFQQHIGYSFKEIRLLEEALTHSSCANEQGLPFNNERLEFLGDAVLELIVSEKIFKENPNLKEGELTRLRSKLVRKESLHSWAILSGLAELVLLGKSIGRGKITVSMAADSAEAVFGAVFLDGGYKSARKLVASYLAFVSEKVSPKELDPKTELQELLQAEGAGVPYYREIARKGPDHALRFLVEAALGEKVLASAWGMTMKEAESNAAEIALKAYKSDK